MDASQTSWDRKIKAQSKMGRVLKVLLVVPRLSGRKLRTSKVNRLKLEISNIFTFLGIENRL